MKTLPNNLPTDLWRKVSVRSFRISKGIYQQFRIQSSQPKTVVLIVGCQRSGTTLMRQIFERDLNTKVYKERSKLTSKDAREGVRLDPLDSVKGIIDQDRAPLVVLKPLVESQNLLQLLNYFEGSRGLWLYRHYKSVTASNLARFGVRNGINNLRPIAKNDPDNWRSQHVSGYVRQIVLKYFSEDMNPYDAAALFWFARNQLFFDLNLENNPMVTVCKYEDLVMQPARVMKNIYDFIGHDFPGERIVAHVHAASVAKGKDVALSPAIERLCRTLLARLDHVNQTIYRTDAEE